MIKAEHKKWADLIFGFYINKILRKDFSSFILLNEFPKIPDDAGLLIAPNHFSWWDGFFIYNLMKKMSSRKLHIMMLENQLERYWFFKKVGAFSINPSNPKSIYKSFLYSKEVLNNPDNFLVIYPQGEIEPFDKENYTIRKGIRNFVSGYKQKAVLLPITFKIHFDNERKPKVYLRFGKTLNFEDIRNDFSLFENEFQLSRNELNKLIESKEFYKNIFDE